MRTKLLETTADSGQTSLHAASADAQRSRGSAAQAAVAGSQQRSAAELAEARQGYSSQRTAADLQGEFPPEIGGKWASGLPFLDPKLKKERPEEAGVQLDLLHVDVQPLQVSANR